MDKERFLQSGLLEQYVLGLTTEEESEEVERFARAFPDVRKEIDQLRNAVRQYAEQEIAAPGFKRRRPETEPVKAPLPQMAGSWSLGNWLSAAIVLLVGALGIYYHGQANQAQQQVAALNTEFEAFKSTCQKDQQSLHDLSDQVAFYHHQLTNLLQLKGTELAPSCKVRVFWNEQQSMALLQVLSLPAQPKENQYQIWADIDGKMVNLGLIDDHDDQPQSIRCLPKAGSLNITLEPLGGSDQPHVNQLYANVSLK